jgi:hypothetical protein
MAASSTARTYAGSAPAVGSATTSTEAAPAMGTAGMRSAAAKTAAAVRTEVR